MKPWKVSRRAEAGGPSGDELYHVLEKLFFTSGRKYMHV